MIAWFYIVVAALFEAGWIYSLKFLDFKKVLGVRNTDEWKVVLPLMGYIVFGVCNIYFFSLAMKNIPASTAFAVWMALALIFSKALDIFVFHEAYNYQQIFFTIIVLVGITGLKYYSKS